MLLSLNGQKIYFDLAGPQAAPTVCFTHSLNSDGGMWAEQLVPLLGAGYRVLRLDMRGHGGSDPVAGDYSMEQLADDVAGSLDFLGISRVQRSLAMGQRGWKAHPRGGASGLGTSPFKGCRVRPARSMSGMVSRSRRV